MIGKVHGNRHTVDTVKLLPSATHREHRAGTQPDHFPSDASQEQSADPASPVRAHDHEVGTALLDEVEDGGQR